MTNECGIQYFYVVSGCFLGNIFQHILSLHLQIYLLISQDVGFLPNIAFCFLVLFL